MVNVDIDINLYEDIRKIVKEDKVNYPSVKYFVNKILLDKSTEIKKEKSLKKIFKHGWKKRQG